MQEVFQVHRRVFLITINLLVYSYILYITNQVNVGEAAKKNIVLHSRCMREMYTFLTYIILI